MVTTKKAVTADASSTLRLVFYGQGTTDHRSATLLRISDRLREELAEVAQGQLYLVIEYALQKLIEDLRKAPPGIKAVGAHELVAGPAHQKVPVRVTRPKKLKVAEE